MKESTIFIPIYNHNIIVIFGFPQDIIDELAQRHQGLDIKQYVKGNGNHFTVVDNNKKVKIDYLVLYDGFDSETIGHESLHLAWEILNDALVEVSYNNQEPLAYLRDYIDDEVSVLIDKWTKIE